MGVVVAVASGEPAAATDPPIAISDDGITYAASYPGQLFQGVRLVPGASATRSFWVKNTGPSGANLAVTLIDVASDDPAYLAGLTIVAASGTHSGGVRFSRAGECASLIYGIHLAQGQSARVDATIKLASHTGNSARGANASFNLGINLTSQDVPAPNGCVVGTNPTPSPSPSPTGTPGGTPGAGGHVVIPGVTPQPSHPTASPTPAPTASQTAAPSPTSTPEPTPTPSVSPSPGPTPGEPGKPGVEGNTDRFYQEWFVAAWVVEFIIGGYFAWRNARRRQLEGAQS